ncbi:3-hydroxybutyryl-CoA dehydrogenase [Tepiditoga spiralis]|uniref:3-hydroxybutyryl-CoA dehydrogenase n=1 Tax=Tepiditoga spiralis TaxID=2108365 RepID=A0A7G1G3K8_9BACT|nr:3-hydroxyacyl-CoA dehydrogenase [Tepiditoga spiralis]BBE31018.1 3-hydroxybutyryl-CoA dehydrogenase [Tepiditoga spiralis]
MEINNVMVAGAGVLGAQIAWQVAFNGFNVVVYDAFEKGLEGGKEFHKKFAKLFEEKKGATKEQIDSTLSRLSYTTNLEEAVKNADLVSESIPEVSEIKKTFYSNLSKVAPEKTIFTTNSSTMLPSMFANETKRPEKFLALHFANPVWDANIGEVMMHDKTDKKYFDIVLNFAKDIGMIPIPIYKEQPGYVLNSLLVPLLKAARTLIFKGISDPQSVDKTWMISTGAKIGPFGIIDMVGMDTVYNIALRNGTIGNDTESLKMAEYCKKNYIDKGKKGIKTGEGFYKYPNPAYQDPNFLINN